VNCPAFHGVVHEYVDGLLAPAEAEAAREHAASCASCAEQLDTARRFARLLAGEGDLAIQAWTARTAADRAALASRAAAPPPAGRLRRLAPFVATAAASIAASLLVVAALAPSAPRTETLAEGGDAVQLPRGKHVLSAEGREIESEGDAVVVVAPGSSGERVRLDSGTALFRVEPGRAFAVETPQGVASVLGTSFHISVGAGKDVAVTVHTGRVKFAGARETVTLAPGDRLEVDAHGAQRLVDRKKLDELEASVHRANSRAEAAVAAAPAPSPTTLGADAIKAFLASDEGHEVLRAAVDAAQSRKMDEAVEAMHEGAFARFAKAADLTPEQERRAKELLKNFGVAFRQAMTPPRGVSPQERNSFWKDGYTKIYDLRKHLDDDLRNILTPVQFDIYLRSYPPPPPAPAAADGQDNVNK
jgi:hypothetical protein